MDDVLAFFQTSEFMPHGHCYLWRPEILFLHAFSDLLVFFANIAIPYGLLKLLKSRPDIPIKKVLYLFVAFILLCGWTHLNEVFAIWIPNYWYAGIIKLLTAIVSVSTAIVLHSFLPGIKSLPHFKTLQNSIKHQTGTIIDSISIGVMTVNKTGTIEFANSEAAVQFGFSDNSEMIGKNIELIIPERFRARHHEQFEQFFQSQRRRYLGTELDLLGLKQDGTEFYLKIGLSTMEIDGHIKVVATIFDQTKLKLQENQIKELNVLYSNAVDGANDGIWDSGSLIGDNTWWSPKFHELLGYEFGELVPSRETFSKLLHEEDRDMVFAAVENHLKHKVPYDIQMRIKGKNQEFRWYRGRGKAIFEGDNPIRMSGILSDIDLQKNLELQFISQNQLLLFMQEETNDGWWDWKIQEDYEYLSPKLWTTLGYKPEDKKHHPDEWRKIIHPEDLVLVNKNFDEHIKSKGEFPYYQTVRYLSANGTYKTVICKGKVVEWDSQDKPLRMVGSHTDITEFQETQSLLVSVNETLRQTNRELEKFAHVVSHDLRAPARHILRYAQDLIENYNADMPKEEVIDSLKSIEKNSLKIGEMIQGLLSVSKLQTQNINKNEVFLSQILQEIFFSLEKEIQESGAIIDIIEDREINVDASLFERVMQNLVDNSIKYRERSRPLKIKITVERVGELDIIKLQDNGIGIHESFIAKVFDIFEKGTEALKYDSHGIGLSICKKIVELHQGSIVVESEYGKGSLFTIKIKA